MSSTALRHFLEAAEQLNFAHAARDAGVTRAQLVASVKQLEAELGYPLFDYSASTTTLTAEGIALRDLTRAERVKSAAAARASAPAPGGKAKASKGKGRAPAVKGERKPGKRRQSR